MDKFIVTQLEKADGYKPLLVTVATHEKLTQMKEETGVSMTRLVAQMVDFCAERLEVAE